MALVVKDPPASAGDMRPGFHPWVGERARQPTPVFLPGESHGQEPGGLQSMDHNESYTTDLAYTHARRENKLTY